MEFVALILFIALQIMFIPLAVVGLILLAIKQLMVSKKMGVSSTAISVIGNRWYMDVFGMREDPASVKLYRALPNGCEAGLWMVYFPSYLKYRISGKNRGPSSKREEGTEHFGSVARIRTLHFDRLINCSKDKAEQFVMMGAGFDTRCYGQLKDSALKLFELDQPATQKMKVEGLLKAGIDISHVTFVSVDFTTDHWYEKLEDAGYDPEKKTLFLWEGVTPYLSESDIRKTLKEVKSHAVSGSILLVDFYDKRLSYLKGVTTTNEGFQFGLDFSGDGEGILNQFLESQGLRVGEFHFMGQKTKKGAFGVVAEILI